ncbi:Putative SOS response-associated peptidase YedK [Bacillus sp. THAF10]|uniref:SOS response-associated peptidase n=1 Tax=Bacillus sp. THAF10 TaxID=2587848 RepID=UPI001268E9D6|nr:SOS response-associated peptidase [Bacillus sp. THAF10]QFT89296.1 Putative SOS response-associated peptidase YedK [Bacillus sp. THAF10]
MCGRFSLTTELHKLAERFFLENSSDLDYQLSFNVAPGQRILAIVSGEKKNRAGYLNWGLVPSFAKDKKIGYKMINARAETLQDKVSFNRLLDRRKCLIPADGFYEWKQMNGKKVPVRFTMKDHEPFAFAGLWDRWVHNKEEYVSCTLITTSPNELVKEVHNRMPVILKKEQEENWLKKGYTDKNELLDMCQPFDAKLMKAYEVSSLVNSPKNNHAKCVEPV